MDTSTDLVVSPTRTAMNVGAIIAALMLVVNAIGWQILGWIVFIGGIYYGMKSFRKASEGYISYFGALNAGIQSAFFASLILAFVGYVTAKLEPATIDATLDMMEQQLKSYDLPVGLAETAIRQWREMLTPVVLGLITILMFSAAGCMVSIVCAFFVRKEQPPVTQ